MHLIPGGAPPPRPRASSRIQSPSVNLRVACTDLLPHQVRAVADAVNPLVADALAFHFKLKSYRWQLTGPRIRECQPLFDEFAAAVLAAADRMADRVRRVGATTVRSAAHASTLQRIPDEHDDVVTIEQMMGRLLADEERPPSRCARRSRPARSTGTTRRRPVSRHSSTRSSGSVGCCSRWFR